MTRPPDPLELLAMRAALVEARLAADAGEVPVGAVVLRHGEIIARAQNRMVRDTNALAHSEVLVLQQAMAIIGTSRLTDCTLVVSLEPCAMCAGAIVHSRVQRLVFGAWDPKAGMCGSVGDLVRHGRLNHQPEVTGGLLEADSALLLQSFFEALR